MGPALLPPAAQRVCKVALPNCKTWQHRIGRQQCIYFYDDEMPATGIARIDLNRPAIANAQDPRVLSDLIEFAERRA